MSARYVIRFGSTRQVGEFAVKPPREIARGTQVIVRSHRGTEWGEVLCPATKRTKELLGRSDGVGQVLRETTPDDQVHRERLWSDQQVAFEGCREEIALHGLPMQLVDCERLFGGEKLLFYYLSENRVDFRQLVKALAKRFRTRIEMRQIGVRDEAKLLADYGDCGKPVCCGTHLRNTPPVSMKMAKVQKASLDPNKISGRCGRLKCCLRYEYDTYEEHRKELPKVGKWIRTAEGIGKVIGQEILAKKVLVRFEDGRRVIVDAAGVLETVPPPERSGGDRGGSDRKSGERGGKAGDGRRSSRGKPPRPDRDARVRPQPVDAKPDDAAEPDAAAEAEGSTPADANKPPETRRRRRRRRSGRRPSDGLGGNGANDGGANDGGE